MGRSRSALVERVVTGVSGDCRGLAAWLNTSDIGRARVRAIARCAPVRLINPAGCPISIAARADAGLEPTSMLRTTLTAGRAAAFAGS